MIGQCSRELLESALADNLSAEDEASLHRHLDECEACGAALEQMAGGAAWCQEAALLLRRDELDDPVPVRDEWSEVDFTVENLEPSDEPNVLGRLGGYDILEIVGRGGMGVVLKGFDRELKRCVAIKVLAPHLAHSSLAKKRFAREAQAAAAVVHPNVLAIHQVQAGGRLPFLVMPLVAGESLAQRLKTQGTLELKEVLRIGMQAAAGLAAAHDQGLVHRDVKPANILLEMGVERAVLTDFGLARAADDVSMTRWGIIAGTPQYMSPEQAKGEPLDGRSDLFSLGCVLYEMATGVSPFHTDSAMATMRRLVNDSPQAMASLNPELPPWFIAIVDRLLEKDPARRFGSAKEVSVLLEGCLAHIQQPASVPLPAALPKSAPASVSGRRKSRFLGFKGVLAMIATLGIGLLGAFLLFSPEPPNIAGQWSGEEWGQVVLKKTNAAEYTGTYTETLGKNPGVIQLKWSRIERRFNGTWREGEDRFGELSVRLVNNEIRGALTTDPKSKINPATPRLADLLWTRSEPLAKNKEAQPSKVIFGPVVERVIETGPRPLGETWALNLATGSLVTSTPEKNLAFPYRVDGKGTLRLKTGDTVHLNFRVGGEDTLRRAKVDVFLPLQANTPWVLNAIDMRLVPLGPSSWDTAPEKVLAALAQEKTIVHKTLSTVPDAIPCAFVTGDGVKGILEVKQVGPANQANPGKIRYKLIQNSQLDAAIAYLKRAQSELVEPWGDVKNGLQVRLPPSKREMAQR